MERVCAAESDAYFESRPRGSQLASAASPQSQVIPNREFLETRVEELDARFPNRVLRPAHWGGYRVIPDVFEFWQGRENRMHDRLRYTRGVGDVWVRERPRAVRNVKPLIPCPLLTCGREGSFMWWLWRVNARQIHLNFLLWVRVQCYNRRAGRRWNDARDVQDIDCGRIDVGCVRNDDRVCVRLRDLYSARGRSERGAGTGAGAMGWTARGYCIVAGRAGRVRRSGDYFACARACRGDAGQCGFV